MKTIQIDDDLFAEIDNRTGLGTFSHSEVVRKLLHRNAPSQKEPPKPEPAGGLGKSSIRSIAPFLQSPEYRARRKGIEKYLAVLSFLYESCPADFERVIEGFTRGNRVYFGKSSEAIEGGGNGAIHAKRIPKSPFWALATLDNKSKSDILIQILIRLNFQRPEIDLIPSRRNEDYA
jgi:negative modulator of initiation of replication